MKMRKMKGGCVEMDRKKINVERMRKDELNKLEDKYKMNLKMMRSVIEDERRMRRDGSEEDK